MLHISNKRYLTKKQTLTCNITGILTFIRGLKQVPLLCSVTRISMQLKSVAKMAGNTDSSRKNCSRTIVLRVLLKFSTVVAVGFVSFLGGYLLNSLYPSSNQEIQANMNPIEQRSTRRLTSHFQTQLLSSFKAENLEENLR